MAILELHNRSVAVFRIQLTHHQPAMVLRIKYAINGNKWTYTGQNNGIGNHICPFLENLKIFIFEFVSKVGSKYIHFKLAKTSQFSKKREKIQPNMCKMVSYFCNFSNMLFGKKSPVHSIPGPGQWHKHTGGHFDWINLRANSWQMWANQYDIYLQEAF